MHKALNSQRGVATLEFAFTVGFFLTMVAAVVAGGHFFWTHNALVEATRRGARYAAMQCRPGSVGCDSSTTTARIKNVVLYNSPTAGSQPFVPGLTTTNVIISYSKRSGSPDTEFFGVAGGSVSVRIEGYTYQFPFVASPWNMPQYETTVRGESAGYNAGQNVCPSASPSPSPTPTP